MKELQLPQIFSGIQKFTSKDFPNKLSATFFTLGCNYRCRYCHNPEFFTFKRNLLLDNNEILSFLKKRVGLIDAIVICGGEPTLHKSLPVWIKYIKSLGYKVKLDTNGTNPDMVKCLIKEKLIDYIAIDFKASKEKFEKVTKRDLNFYYKTIETIKLVMGSYLGDELLYDIRTTIHSDLLSKNDIIKMSNVLVELGVGRYALQMFVDNGSFEHLGVDVTESYISELSCELGEMFDCFEVRNR